MNSIDPIRRRRGSPTGLAGVLLIWTERVRHRRILRRLDNHLLDDIGLSRRQAEAESQKPFWQA